MKETKNHNWILPAAFSLAGAGLILIILFALIPPFNNYGNIDSELFYKYGSFIGGVVGPLFSLAGFILIYKTLSLQKEAIEKQQKSFERERFETTFFNLLRTQQEIRNSIVISDVVFYSESLENEKFVGITYFSHAKKEIKKIWDSLENVTEYIHNQKESKGFIIYNPDLVPEYLKEFTYKKYNINQEDFNNYKQITNLKEKLSFIYELFFNNGGNKIGHYYRHLYHILLYIEKHEENVNIKYQEYVDFVQAQLSSSELVLIFYNSMLFKNLNRLLIKYNVLENITEDLIDKSHDEILKEMIKPNTNN